MSAGKYVPPHLRKPRDAAQEVASPPAQARLVPSGSAAAPVVQQERPYAAPRWQGGRPRSPVPAPTALPSGPSSYASSSPKGHADRRAGATPWDSSSASSKDKSGFVSIAKRRPPAVYTHAPPILSVHGDSFVGVFRCLRENTVDLGWYSGASAKGLNNPNSTRQVAPQLLASIDSLRVPKILMMFGNVDININYVFALRRKDGKPALIGDDFVKNMFEAYTAFMRDELEPRLVNSTTPIKQSLNSRIKPKFIEKIYIANSVPPIVPDEALGKMIDKYRIAPGTVVADLPPLKPTEEIMQFANIKMRQDMTKTFTRLAREFCATRPDVYQLVDINPYITSLGKPADQAEDGVVSPDYISEDPTNVHLLWETTIQFWVRELASAGLKESHIRPDLQEQAADYVRRKQKTMTEIAERDAAIARAPFVINEAHLEASPSLGAQAAMNSPTIRQHGFELPNDTHTASPAQPGFPTGHAGGVWAHQHYPSHNGSLHIHQNSHGSASSHSLSAMNTDIAMGAFIDPNMILPDGMDHYGSVHSPGMAASPFLGHPGATGQHFGFSGLTQGSHGQAMANDADLMDSLMMRSESVHSQPSSTMSSHDAPSPASVSGVYHGSRPQPGDYGQTSISAALASAVTFSPKQSAQSPTVAAIAQRISTSPVDHFKTRSLLEGSARRPSPVRGAGSLGARRSASATRRGQSGTTSPAAIHIAAHPQYASAASTLASSASAYPMSVPARFGAQYGSSLNSPQYSSPNTNYSTPSSFAEGDSSDQQHFIPASAPTSLGRPATRETLRGRTIKQEPRDDSRALLTRAVPDKKKRRKEQHCAVEQRRRSNINDKIAELATLLPQIMLDPTAGSREPSRSRERRTGSAETEAETPMSPFGPGTSSFDARHASLVTAGLPSNPFENMTVQQIAQQSSLGRPNKGLILAKSVDYIRHLQQIIEAQAVRTEELEDTLRANGISPAESR
ncbi:uncharacterized protein L969DRAFT_91499 [Mixia osmundae IAM 14324]|uniref:BHLH domain-containing protein n=1 Tax=Mixia osmundae (strain CBS 9802 / IAM 14324 / JCM 22182 / KY 12970) TaxID=764103 RepID=G7DVD5_MIXOS|nr:uncharacterized protein L969DRAFT_91499 [Mixia osmundae IAM 14324]KEI42034.1 hypothetical protein L969DRAFT_91499 [Mixia osmundae IAM 14324]GAA94545.1 hypothetical protein E5Q_01197 [Mixia osmundae IAM 14324]